ncbi:MAG: flagellar protein FliS [Firmicutes bacterium]|nr:flagellar protein FliS [Bacillota bacterium]MDH7496362.1 flagellar protein FliS [Bacillota bacterium]
MNAELDVLQAASEYRGRSAQGVYRAQQVLSARPEELVLMVYDHIIASCRAKDKKKASAGIATLIDSLDLDQGEVAAGLFRLYRYAMERVWKGEFGEALSVMRPLRETWAAATKGRVSTANPLGIGPAVSGAERVGASATG